MMSLEWARRVESRGPALFQVPKDPDEAFTEAGLENDEAMPPLVQKVLTSP